MVAAAAAAQQQPSAPLAATASNELPDVRDGWRTQLLATPFRSEPLPVFGGVFQGLPALTAAVSGGISGGVGGTLRVETTLDADASAQDSVAAVAAAAAYATVHTPRESLSDGAPLPAAAAAASAAAAVAAADGHALSAPLLQCFASCGPGFESVAASGSLLESRKIAQFLGLDDEEPLDDPVTEADLIAALQEGMEGDSGAWQQELLMIEHQEKEQQRQQQQHGATSPSLPPVVVGWDSFSSGVSSGMSPEVAPPGLIQLGSFNSSTPSSSGAAAAASEGDAVSTGTARAAAAAVASAPGMEASSCSLPLARLQLGAVPDSPAMLGVSDAQCASAPLPQLSPDISMASIGGRKPSSLRAASAFTGAAPQAAAVAALQDEQQQQLNLPAPLLTQQSSGKSSRLQWLVQQVQLELQTCENSDLECLSETELAMLLHTLLVSGSGGTTGMLTCSQDSAAAAPGGSAAATPGFIASSGTTAAAAAVEAEAQAGAASGLTADQCAGLQQHSNGGIKLLQKHTHQKLQEQGFPLTKPFTVLPGMSSSALMDDFLVNIRSTGGSTAPGVYTSASSNAVTAPLPLCNLVGVSGGGKAGAAHWSATLQPSHPQLPVEVGAAWKSEQNLQQQQQYITLLHQQQQQQYCMLLQQQQQEQMMQQQAGLGGQVSAIHAGLPGQQQPVPLQGGIQPGTTVSGKHMIMQEFEALMQGAGNV